MVAAPPRASISAPQPDDTVAVADGTDAAPNTDSATVVEQPVAAAAGRDQLAATSVRVLLVEDNPGDARLVQRTLASADGFTLTHVERLKLALNLLRERTFDLVLLDLSLPDGRGLETVTRVHDASPQLPIVVLTGLDDHDLALAAVGAGAQDYLVKGEITGALLMRSLRYSLERARLQQREQAARADLAVALGRAEAALALREQFLATAAHELRTPLTALKTHVQLARRQLARTGSTEGVAAHLERAEVQTNRLIRLTRDLLDASRLATGHLAIEREMAPLIPVIRGALDVIRAVAPERAVLAELPETDVVILVDPARLEQALNNLLENAHKYSPADRPIRLDARVTRDAITIAITDEGRGIPPEEQERIFDRFYRAGVVPAGTTGWGLGLSITQAIVRLHQGRLELTSTPGQGSTFTVVLPRPTL